MPSNLPGFFRPRSLASLLVLLCGCGGFTRGKPSPMEAGVCMAGPESGRFAVEVYPILEGKCMACHVASGVASSTEYVLSGELEADHEVVRALVDVDSPADSKLLSKASGNSHGGGSVLSSSGSEYKTILDWIADGALLGGGDCVQPVVDSGMKPDVPDKDSSVADSGKGNGKPDSSVKPDATVDAGTRDSGMPDATVDAGDAAKPPVISFADEVDSVLLADCEVCHNSTGIAASTKFILGGSVDDDFASALDVVDLNAPADSLMLQKATGNSHGGGQRFAEDSSEYDLLLQWIEGGAQP